METLALDTILLHNDTRAAYNFTGVTLLVDLAQSRPGTKNFGISNLDQVDFVLGTESLDKLDVLRLRTGLNKDAQMGLALVQGFGCLAETTGESVVN